MRALTLWQPMAWAIAEGHKLVENRPWALPKNMIGQQVALHAGRHWDQEMADQIRDHFDLNVPTKTEITLGAVVAVMTFVGCIHSDALFGPQPEDLPPALRPRFQDIHDWYSGPYGFLIADVRKLQRPVFCRGLQGLWPLDADTHSAVLNQLNGPPPEAAHEAAHAERARCLAMIRARASHWRSNGNGLVASALDHLAEEIDLP